MTVGLMAHFGAPPGRAATEEAAARRIAVVAVNQVREGIFGISRSSWGESLGKAVWEVGERE